MTHYKVDHLLHRLITLLISFPYICLIYFMAFCIGFARVEFLFSEGPLLTQPWCTTLSSCFPFVFFFFPSDICILSDTGCYLNYSDLNLIIQVSLLPKSNYWWVGGQELNLSSTKPLGLFEHGISYQFRVTTSAVLLHTTFRKISRKPLICEKDITA